MPPGQLLYSTGLSPFLWIVTNRKTSTQGKVVPLDARSLVEVLDPATLGPVAEGERGELVLATHKAKRIEDRRASLWT